VTNICLFPGAHGPLFSHARAILTFILNTAIPGFLARNPNPISKSKALARQSRNQSRGVRDDACRRIFLMENFTSVGTFHPLAKRMYHPHGGYLLSEMHDSSI